MLVTQRLYHEDPYRTEFDARVVGRSFIEGSPAVALDATCFYPTAGGQPHDTGMLDDVRVVDVVEDVGSIWHVVARPVPGERVRGLVDWPRRFDHMQQHTGQHILSQAFVRVLGAETVSFHLGSASSTIDVEADTLDEEALQRVEDSANRVLYENRAVTTREVHERDIGQVPLRKPPTVHGVIRVVLVDGYDASACGGTHVRVTGEVGCIRLKSWQRHRGNSRIEFVCGWRALTDHRALANVCRQLSAKLSAGVEDLPHIVERQLEEIDSLQRQVEDLRGRLVAADRAELEAQAVDLGPLRVVARVLEGYQTSQMRQMAQELARFSGMVALLAVSDPAPQFCFARADDVTIDMGALLCETLRPLGGKGGGKPHLAQGGGGPAQALPDALRAALESVRAMASAMES